MYQRNIEDCGSRDDGGSDDGGGSDGGGREYDDRDGNDDEGMNETFFSLFHEWDEYFWKWEVVIVIGMIFIIVNKI